MDLSGLHGRMRASRAGRGRGRNSRGRNSNPVMRLGPGRTDLLQHLANGAHELIYPQKKNGGPS